MMQLENCEIDYILTDEHKQFGIMICRAPANYNIINLLYKGHVIASFQDYQHTDTEIRASATMFMEEKCKEMLKNGKVAKHN